MPGVFAFADQVIGNPQTSRFAAFGSFAVLVLVEFGGLRRTRLVAYLALAAVGAAFITLGTFCSRDAWLAAGATGAVGFVTLFSGAFNGYLAAASTGAILLFVLPANIPAPNSAIPDRLFGFALAAGVGTAASLVLWPPRRRADFDRLRSTRNDVARAFIRRLPELPPSADAAVLPETLETPFRVRAVTYAARQVGLYAMRATGGNVPSDEEADLAAPLRGSLDAAEQLALEHASVRSVWLQNSIRGAVALAVSVFIAQSLSLQHGFWVVLGTLSVL